MNTLTSLTAISAIDGRYADKTAPLRTYLSEYALFRYRTFVEIAWFNLLSKEKNFHDLPPLSNQSEQALYGIASDFSISSAQRIKEIEKKIQHDVKAVEYYIKEQLSHIPELDKYQEFVHFACTSEDINNIAYALMLKESRDQVLLPSMKTLLTTIRTMMDAHAGCAMLSRTHGQPASPTTLGKELANVLFRLQKQVASLEAHVFTAKINGAVGNYNAHQISYPEVNWPALSCSFVESLGLEWNCFTTQIEPHDNLAVYFDNLKRVNTILIDFCRDVWGYISLGYFVQRANPNEVGSSTMPHKVNPIDFENAEGNLAIANALCEHFSQKLPISRWQRDLTDSTTLRTVGTCLAHSYISWQSVIKGMSRLSVDEACIAADLNRHWEVLAEAIQTVMRRYHIAHPYEKLKELTRGKPITRESFTDLIAQLELPTSVKLMLQELTPADYTGLATQLTENFPR